MVRPQIFLWLGRSGKALPTLPAVYNCTMPAHNEDRKTRAAEGRLINGSTLVSANLALKLDSQEENSAINLPACSYAFYLFISTPLRNSLLSHFSLLNPSTPGHNHHTFTSQTTSLQVISLYPLRLFFLCLFSPRCLAHTACFPLLHRFQSPKLIASVCCWFCCAGGCEGKQQQLGKAQVV